MLRLLLRYLHVCCAKLNAGVKILSHPCVESADWRLEIGDWRLENGDRVTPSATQRPAEAKVAGPERVAGPAPMYESDRVASLRRSASSGSHSVDAH